MKSLKEIRTERKRNKAQRNLEKMLNYYSHNNVVLQLQITSYLHSFCRNKYGEVHPDRYIEDYINRMEKKLADISE